MNNKTRVQYLLLRKVLQQKYGVPTNVMNQMIWFIPPECKGEILEWDKWVEDPHEYAYVWYDWWITTYGIIHLFYGDEYKPRCEYCLCKIETKQNGWDASCPNSKCGLDVNRNQDYIDHFKNE